MKDDVHRICRNREAVIMRAALFLVNRNRLAMDSFN